MRFKGTIFLSALLVFLGFYLIYVEFPQEKRKQEEALKEGDLFSFTMSEISRITIVRPEGEIELEYAEGHPSAPWRIYKPVVTVADEQLADDLAARLVGIKASRLVTEKAENLADFGLDQPAYTLIITLKDNDTLLVEIGVENLTGSDVYVRLGLGTGIYLVPAPIKNLVERDLLGWRRKELFPHASFDVEKIRLISHAGLLELSREGKGEGWRLVIDSEEETGKKSLEATGHSGTVSNLLGSLINLRGSDYIDVGKQETKARFGAPLLRAILKVGAVDRIGTFFRDESNEDRVYVETGKYDPIYRISKQEFDAINQPFEAYRDKKLLSLDFPDQIAEIEISRGGEVLSLNRKDGIWWLEGGGIPKKIEVVEKVSRFLTDLYNLELVSFLDDLDPASTESGLLQPQVTLHLRDKNGLSLGELSFGFQKDEHLYASSTQQPHPFFMKTDVLALIPEEADLFSSLEPTLSKQNPAK